METIRSSREIDRLFTAGKRLFNPYITLIYSTDNPLEYPQQSTGRVAFIAGKKNGNAVWRNAAKRRMRELCRELGGPWPGVNVIFLAKKRILQDSYSKVRQSCKKTLALLDGKVS